MIFKARIFFVVIRITFGVTSSFGLTTCSAGFGGRCGVVSGEVRAVLADGWRPLDELETESRFTEFFLEVLLGEAPIVEEPLAGPGVLLCTEMISALTGRNTGLVPFTLATGTTFCLWLFVYIVLSGHSAARWPCLAQM